MFCVLCFVFCVVGTIQFGHVLCFVFCVLCSWYYPIWTCFVFCVVGTIQCGQAYSVPGIALAATRGGAPQALETPRQLLSRHPVFRVCGTLEQVSYLPFWGYLGQGLILAHSTCVTHAVKLCNHLRPLLSRAYLRTTFGELTLERRNRESRKVFPKKFFR